MTDDLRTIVERSEGENKPDETTDGASLCYLDAIHRRSRARRELDEIDRQVDEAGRKTSAAAIVAAHLYNLVLVEDFRIAVLVVRDRCGYDPEVRLAGTCDDVLVLVHSSDRIVELQRARVDAGGKDNDPDGIEGRRIEEIRSGELEEEAGVYFVCETQHGYRVQRPRAADILTWVDRIKKAVDAAASPR